MSSSGHERGGARLRCRMNFGQRSRTSPSRVSEVGNVMADVVLHDTYFVWNWGLSFIFLLVVIVLVLGAAALIKYLFFR
jgi:hypothetical protein